MAAKKLKNIVVEITRGDITQSKAMALVNAANNELWMGAGVAGALKSKGGIEIEKEAIEKGPITIGSAVETTAGRLGARFVIHAAVMGSDLRTNEDYIRRSTAASLALAEKLAIDSIAFPALGTGVGRFPIGRCAEIMLNEAVKFDKNGPVHIKKVEFVLFAQQGYDEFEKKYMKI